VSTRSTGAVGASNTTTRGSGRSDERTNAQWYAYVIGAVLTLVGILGFIADSSFDTGAGGDAAGNANGALQGDGFLGFEVNGWHNVIHILSGLFLLAMAGKRRTAKPAVLGFGVIYGIVTLIGLIDGNDVLGLFPVNAADNILHILLTLLAFAAALTSRSDDPQRRDDDVDSSRRGDGRLTGTTNGTTGTARTTGGDHVAGPRGRDVPVEDTTPGRTTR
jgi:hypothetical protein